jgi:hypothetical protein
MDDAGDITDGTVKTGNWDNKTGNIPVDGTAVDWDGGASTGTLIHASESNGGSGGDQYLIDVTGGSLADDDVILDVATSTDGFTINGTPDSAIITAECYDDDGDLADEDITIDGFTTDATNYVKITSLSTERHTGIAGTGFVIDVSGTDSNGIYIRDFYTVVEWIEIKNWVSQFTASRTGIKMDFVGDNSTVQNCIAHDSEAADEHIGIQVDDGGQAYNNIVYDVSGDGIDSTATNAGDIYNNTVYNCGGIGVDTNGGNTKNNIAIGNGTDFSFGASTHDYNASGDATANGANSLNSGSGASAPTTADFEDVTGGSEDLHLVSTAVEIDEGVDLGTVANIDIDGRDRDAEGDTWDIGADEFVSAVVAKGQIIFIN